MEIDTHNTSDNNMTRRVLTDYNTFGNRNFKISLLIQKLTVEALCVPSCKYNEQLSTG